MVSMFSDFLENSVIYNYNVGHEICVRESLSCIFCITTDNDNYAKIHGRIGIVSFLYLLHSYGGHLTFIRVVTSFQNEDAFAELYYSAYFSNIFSYVTYGYNLFAVQV